MKRLLSKMMLVPLIMLILSACGGTGTNGGNSSPSLATIANFLGTWLASSGNSEDIDEIGLSDIFMPDEAGVFVRFKDGSPDVGFLEFTNNDTTTRGVRVKVSSGIFNGTIQLFDDCQTMQLTLEGESGTFTNAGNSCTDN